MVLATEGPRANATDGRRVALGIPQFLLSPGLRLIFLRFCVVFSIWVAGFDIQLLSMGEDHPKFKAASAMTFVTAIHHVITAFGPSVPLSAGVDLFLTAAEAIGHPFKGFYLRHMYLSAPQELGNGQKWWSKLALLALVSVWIVALSLIALLFLKALDIFNKRGGRPMRQRLDVGGMPHAPRWKYLVRALFGRGMYKQIVPGESKWLALLRGLLAAISVCTLVAFGIYHAIISPISEMGIVSYRSYRASSSALAGTLDEAFTNRTGWHVALRLPWGGGPHSVNLAPSITAKAILDDFERLSVPCPVTGNTVEGIAVVSCPTRIGLAPRLDIMVNYTTLFGDTPSLGVSYSLAAYIGVVEDVEKIIANTDRIFLFRGAHFLAVVATNLRQQLNPGELATLGFDTYESFMVAVIRQLMPNHDTVAVNDKNLATLTILRDVFPNDWTVLRDYRSKSVLTGLSFVGGLGSFLSTLLVVMLGTSLMRSVTRSKPHSPFGFLHNLRVVQSQMVTECERMYPAIKDDIKKQKEKPGVVAYLLTTLVDMDALGFAEQDQTNRGQRESGSAASVDANQRDIEKAMNDDDERGDVSFEEKDVKSEQGII
ncbi:hypothetical protein NMY22_g16792 [Coprinellus aureogranulatus]|nr:hypothetical protein NMY22_g16792 [Coprinellus aureogranulatus]